MRSENQSAEYSQRQLQLLQQNQVEMARELARARAEVLRLQSVVRDLRGLVRRPSSEQPAG